MLERLANLDKKTIYYRVTRREIGWYCSECKKEFKSPPPPQCSCGATDKVFLEKLIPIKETERSDYSVLRNISCEGQQLLVGYVVSLIDDNEMTKDWLNRKLVIQRKLQKKQ